MSKPQNATAPTLPQGTRVYCNGYPGVIIRRYSANSYEIRVPGGPVCTDAFALTPEEYRRRWPGDPTNF